MNIDTLTVDDVRAMTDEEKVALNKAIARKFGKKILTQLAVVTVVGAALHFANQRMNANAEIDIIDSTI